MPSTNSDSKTTTTPWKGYQPYLVGQGPIPEWITKGAPTGISEGLAADLAARAAGAPGSWLQSPPLDPYTYSSQAPLAPPGGQAGGQNPVPQTGPLAQNFEYQGYNPFTDGGW